MILHRLILLLLTAALCVGGTACNKKKTQAELNADRVRLFREKQRNSAIQKYQELATKYPESEFAEKATQKLQTLGPASTPAKKAAK